MRARKVSAVLCLLMFLTLFAGCTAAKGSVKVKQGNDLTKTVDLTQQETTRVEGNTKDASGDVKVDADGILVSDVLMAAGIESSWIGNISVESRDKNTVELTGTELNMANKAYLVAQDDGSWDLVVLGDDGFVLKDVVFLHAQNI